MAREQKEPRENRMLSPSLILSITALAVAVILPLTIGSREKIGVVRTADLVAAYKGMEDARGMFEEQRKKWQGEIDTLEADYRRSVNRLNAEWESLTQSERSRREELAGAQRENLARYGQSLQQRTHEEEEKLMQGVLHQVNSAIREYAQANGYDAIYGATPDGSILYGSDGLDITEQLIAELNRKYTGTEHEESVEETNKKPAGRNQPEEESSHEIPDNAKDTGR